MGLLAKLKGLTKGRKKEIKEGVDKVADVIESKVPDQHDAKVDDVRDNIDKAIGTEP